MVLRRGCGFRRIQVESPIACRGFGFTPFVRKGSPSTLIQDDLNKRPARDIQQMRSGGWLDRGMLVREGRLAAIGARGFRHATKDQGAKESSLSVRSEICAQFVPQVAAA